MKTRVPFPKATIAPVFTSKRNFDPLSLPGSCDLYSMIEADFIPEGKTWEQLTKEERESIKNKYRFAPFYSGKNKHVTGKMGGGKPGNSMFKRF